ncbi:hypothetical protein Fleli_1054 [Bernardetia litoralis DSM 6794]|uniref:Uncharacterized protein n=1 Tax=Bernardetia litoralis (strain ATCC 23117 / DSM 6794 / NBRC 15988 / NCIMB 1366 / Fx l1 / Sio-4) TaxID=880071 RepID=I4AHR4_BERLS|nr:DUF6498-containing protein [Bernardetia litoralis]AFM03499.1 hypothetical protein Fleli_1054 [Bernardetia litoralis DSM 6794]
MPTSTLTQLYAKNIGLIRFLFSLITNTYTFFGIIFWNWNFFTIIYLYWAEEVIRIIFRLVENRIEYNKNQISKSELKMQNKISRTMLFPMFVYLVFIIVIVGIIAAPNNDIVIDNLFTVFFKDIEFNLNLLLAIISEIVVLIYLFRKLSKNKFDSQSEKEAQEELEQEFLKEQQEEEDKTYKNLYQKDMATKNNQHFSTQMLVLHVSIVLGTLLYFAANTDKLPIQINLGAAGEFAFVIVFAVVQMIAEVVDFVQSKR